MLSKSLYRPMTSPIPELSMNVTPPKSKTVFSGRKQAAVSSILSRTVGALWWSSSPLNYTVISLSAVSIVVCIVFLLWSSVVLIVFHPMCGFCQSAAGHKKTDGFPSVLPVLNCFRFLIFRNTYSVCIFRKSPRLLQGRYSPRARRFLRRALPRFYKPHTPLKTSCRATRIFLKISD